jgi:predicted ATPase
MAPVDTKSNHEKDSANNNYASILLYIQNNPSKSFKFIQDIKQKFFDNSCSIKNDIDFNKIAQLPNGMVF